MQRLEVLPDDTDVRLIEDVFPVLVHVAPLRHGPDTIARMTQSYERIFARRERYVLLTVTPRAAEPMGARERRAVTEWANTPRIRKLSAEVCVGSAIIAKDAVARGVLTAMFWLWKPVMPTEVTTSVDEAVDYCIAQLERTGVAMPMGARKTRSETLARVRSL